MRLLLRSNTGEFSFTKDLVGDDTIPPYAILSHTWKDGQEVTFKDLRHGTGKNKAGYGKIRFCGQQAERDSLQYFWVDTCCIDKSNHVELQEAINSMFRWYQNAAKCYVYLSDVSTAKRKASDECSECTWEPAFRESRWFTRGWTLQELLAPRSVEFFSREGKPLGNKRTLERQIHEITSISILALQGTPLSEFGVEERLSWAKSRQSTRKEDKAYSLLGIFGIYMSLIYGEGEENAFQRLRKKIDRPSKGLQQQQASVQMDKEDQECIQHLRLTDPRDDKKRIEETKGGLLEDSYHWILENSDFQRWRDDRRSRLLWIKGDPGKGKTMLLCGIVKELEKSIAKTDLLSYFFCQATDSRINNATAVLRGLIYLLVDQQPSLTSHIRKKHDHAGKALFEDANAWVALSEILINILQDPTLNSTYLIIDALDECVANLSKLLDFIVLASSISSRIKCIVSSRNWPEIEERLERAGHKVKLCLELNAESVSTAVTIYIQHKVLQLAELKKYDNRTRDAVLGYLSSNANNTFLWVALVCQNLEKIPRWNTLARLNAFPPGLDSLYERMMQQICNSNNADLCKRTLASIAIVYRPITLEELTSLVEMLDDMADDLELLREIISLCGSFLTIREDIIYFVHQSAKDFLLFTKAFSKIFPSGREEAHYMIFSRSLQIMSRMLRRDMYGLCSLGYPTERVEKSGIDSLAASRYSCIYWIDHLCDWKPNSHANHTVDLQDGGAIDSFIRKKYLYLLEALSLCKSMSEGVVSMAKLEALVKERADASELIKLVQDACRFIMYHKWAIENSPLQAYAPALVFSPARSLIRDLFKHEEPKWITIKPAIGDKWSACLQTLEGHNDSVWSVSFSPNSARLASASADRTVKIWDSSSGECLQTLEGHNDSVYSVAFSPNSARLASASDDSTIKIWDASNSECLQTLEGHSHSVRSVSFSPNSARLASASADRTVKIWDASNGECLQTLEGHGDWVYSVAFSPDSARLASASYDNTVKIWDSSSGKCLLTLEGHGHSVSSVAFSPNLARLASASYDKTVKIWDSSTGKCLQTLEGHGHSVRSVAFSPDSARLASASADRTVKIWDSSSGECLQTLKGHSHWVRSVAFSPNSARLASASYDKTVKIWDSSSSECPQTLEGHNDSVRSVAFSPDSAWLASASNDNTVKIWDSSSGECLQTLEGHNDSVSSVAFSPNSAWLASASADRMVKIWDSSSGECLQTLEGHDDSVGLVAFSPNSTWLASASYDKTVKIWNSSNGECLQTLEGHYDWVYSVAFSPDSARLASASYDSTIKIWDVGSSECLQTLEGHGHSVRSVAFSRNSTRLASASDDSTIKIWDASSGECLRTFSIARALFNISFDATGSSLHTEIGPIVIDGSDASSASNTTQSVTDPQIPQYQGVGLSSNGVWITYNSENLVWLPSEYRPSCSAVSGKTIGIGVGSGKVWICNVGLNYS